MLKIDQLSRPVIYLLALALMATIGVVDYFASAEISLSVFYLLPIALVAWGTGRRDGVLAAMVGAIVWFFADGLTLYSHPFFPYWNAGVRLLFFLIVVYTLTEMRRAMDREKSLARVDFLTGIPNSKAFYELAGHELERCRRSGLPMTIAYLDCDHFKAINDSMGHQAGDELLRAVAQVIVQTIRGADLGARIGGDEFVILLPDTSAEDARKAIDRVHAALIETVRQRQWPVTFSIGAVTFTRLSESLDQMVCRADNLMYQAKTSGRDRVVHETA